MTTNEILQKIAKKKTVTNLLIDLKVNSEGLIYFTNYDLKDIDVKSNITNLLASNQIIIELIDIKIPGFKQMIEEKYSEIISNLEISIEN